MAVKRVPREGQTDWIQIVCDQCDVEAPPAEAIIKGGGLNAMGWECHGGTHLCPAHAQARDR